MYDHNLSPKQNEYCRIVDEQSNETTHGIHSGLVASCKCCQDYWNFELSIDDFILNTWSERDRLLIELIDRYTQQIALIEFWDEDARQWLEDWGLQGKSEDRIKEALWDDADNLGFLDNIPADGWETIIQEKINREKYLDEGSFSHRCCELCGNLPGERYVAHGWIKDDDTGKDNLCHWDICQDCLFYLENGDIPDDEYLDHIEIGQPTDKELEQFTQSFLECLLWSSTDIEGNPLDDDYGIENISINKLQEIENDCEDFLRENYHLIRDEYLVGGKPGTLAIEYAGSDFCLTRNGHGAGFWDGRWQHEIGKILTQKSKEYGSCEIYPDGEGNLE